MEALELDTLDTMEAIASVSVMDLLMEALELDTLVTMEAIASVSVMDLAMEALEMDMDTKSMTLFLTTTTTPLLIATLEPDLIRRSTTMEQEPERDIPPSTFPMAGSNMSTITPTTMMGMLLR